MSDMNVKGKFNTTFKKNEKHDLKRCNEKEGE